MKKEDVLNLIQEYEAIFQHFLNEYYEEFSEEFANTPLLPMFIFFDNIKNRLNNDIISASLYDRIYDLLKKLEVEKLDTLLKSNMGNHDYKIYHDILDIIAKNSSVALQTYCMIIVIGEAHSKVVFIGANGSGKTTFANSIREQFEKTEMGIVIPAQKLLIFPTYSSIPKYDRARKNYYERQFSPLDEKQTFEANKIDDIPYNLTKLYGSELMNLVSVLVAERVQKRNQYCSNIKNRQLVHCEEFKTLLDDIIDIWNNLIEHRTLFCNDSCDLMIEYEGGKYPAYMMSAGEREIFYVLGRVMLAPESSLVIIDEPEMHLHKAILNKLWDVIEDKRKDCSFVYLTHDVDFASSRKAQKMWLKSYVPNELGGKWDVEPIMNSEIPENLLLKLLGSRKKILFCEGKDGSLDKDVYEIIFPDFTIMPLGSCKDVVNYTKAYNQIGNKYTEAYGVIDRDFRMDEEIKQCSKDNIYPLEVAEIENLFMLEDFINGFMKYKNEKYDINKIKEEVLNYLVRDKEQQIASYVTQKIEYTFKNSHIKRGKDKCEVIQHFNDFCSEVDIEESYKERNRKIESIIKAKNYQQAIRIYNNKGLHGIVMKALKLGDYRNKALEYLKESKEARDIIRLMLPKELVNISSQR